jgi:hypothetical protein
MKIRYKIILLNQIDFRYQINKNTADENRFFWLGPRARGAFKSIKSTLEPRTSHLEPGTDSNDF